MKLQTHSVTSAASFVMAAGIAALNGPQDCIQEMVASYAARRRFMLDALEEIPGIACAPIEGAFYLFPTFPNTALNSAGGRCPAGKGRYRLHPGIEFGAGEGHVRFSIATAMSDLERGGTVGAWRRGCRLRRFGQIAQRSGAPVWIVLL
ncbi:aminotransferase class I/II-fold pyridoxal phosphate-dependent enzyme [Candidatus Amarolinea dominans]|uniref:aminotransferase class I/II-fold pyridoxal phosphate-dependent enzyme n=1 Tax=Candidatus Amarolinea dominans TaxID=3140696 RepID=UPI0031CC61C7